MPPTQIFLGLISGLEVVLSCSHALMRSCSHPQSRAAFGESEVVIIYKSRNYVALDDLNSQFQNFNNDCIFFLLLLHWHLVSTVFMFLITRISMQSFHKSQTWVTDNCVQGSNLHHSEHMSCFDCCLTSSASWFTKFIAWQFWMKL